MAQNIIQIRIHGRGGQGVVTAAELTALAAFYDGHEAQAFPAFGVERTGAPIMAFVRIGQERIKTREQVYHPDFLIIQDATLLDDPETIRGTKATTKILVNSSDSAVTIYHRLSAAAKNNRLQLSIKEKNIATAPATEIALATIGRNVVNTVILGALIKYYPLFSLTALKKAMADKFQGKKDILEKNLAAITKIYETDQPTRNFQK